MAGLLRNAAPADGSQSNPAMMRRVDPAPAPAPAPAEEDDGGDEEGQQPNASPEEQAAYDAAVKNGYALIYGEDGSVRPEILKALQAGSDPSKDKEGDEKFGEKMALAQTAVSIVGQLDDSSTKAGATISDEVLAHVGQAIVEDLAQVMEGAKIADLSEEDITGAFYLALDMYRDKAIANGRTDEQTLKGQFGEIEQASQQGRLGDVVPGLGPDGPPGAPQPPAQAPAQQQGAA